MKICIIDYGMGNIYSVLNSFKFISSEAAVVNDSRKLNQYSAFILPGVGAFPYAIKNMNESKLSEELKNQILIKKKLTLNLFMAGWSLVKLVNLVNITI
jgi:glutamine amidotransferase